MVNYMGNWHLIAYCQMRKDWRNFVLGRMTLCSIEDACFSIRDKEQWQPYLQDTFGIFQNKRTFPVVLKFTPERSRWMKGEIWHEHEAEELPEDGSLVKTIPVCKTSPTREVGDVLLADTFRESRPGLAH